MCFFNAEPPPSGCLLVKQLSWFGFKPKESPQSVLNEKDMELGHTYKDSGIMSVQGGWGNKSDQGGRGRDLCQDLPNLLPESTVSGNIGWGPMHSPRN